MNLIDKSHKIWEGVLTPGDHVIDATCGNGHDTLFLAKCVDLERGGKVFAFDIQEKALLTTKPSYSTFYRESCRKKSLFS